MSFDEASRREIERLFLMIDFMKEIQANLRPIIGDQSQEQFDDLLRSIDENNLIEKAKTSFNGLIELKMLNDFMEFMLSDFIEYLLTIMFKNENRDFRLEGNAGVMPAELEDFIFGLLSESGINPNEVSVIKIPKEKEEQTERDIIEDLEKIYGKDNFRVVYADEGQSRTSQEKRSIFDREELGNGSKKRTEDAESFKKRFFDLAGGSINSDSILNDPYDENDGMDDSDEDEKE